jgi:hypothetical protein
MTFRPERSIGFAFLFLVFALAAPPVADWLRTRFQLPPGYGAEGDRRRASRIPARAADQWGGTRLPAPVQATVQERSAGAEASWVKATIEDGARVYELHVLRCGEWSVIRITSDGNVIPPGAPQPENGTSVEAGG